MHGGCLAFSGKKKLERQIAHNHCAATVQTLPSQLFPSSLNDLLLVACDLVTSGLSGHVRYPDGLFGALKSPHFLDDVCIQKSSVIYSVGWIR